MVEILLFRSSFALLTILYHNIYSSTKVFIPQTIYAVKWQFFIIYLVREKNLTPSTPMLIILMMLILNYSIWWCILMIKMIRFFIFDLRWYIGLPTKLWWLALQITKTKLMKSYLSPSCPKRIVQKNICQEYELSICDKARVHKKGCFGILSRLVSRLLFTWDGHCRISTESLKHKCYTPPRLTLCTWPREITFAMNSVFRCLCYKQTNKQILSQ